MEPPNDLHPDSIRNEKLKVLKSIKPISPGRVAAETVRGQYGNGIVGGREVPGYLQEEGVDPASETETFVAIRAYLDSWRWAGSSQTSAAKAAWLASPRAANTLKQRNRLMIGDPLPALHLRFDAVDLGLRDPSSLNQRLHAGR